jgi:hypothetical protein
MLLNNLLRRAGLHPAVGPATSGPLLPPREDDYESDDEQDE